MKVLKQYIIPLVCLITVSSFSQIAKAETGLQEYDGMTKSISKLDKKKNTLTLGGKEFKYNGNTKIVNYKNEVVTEDALIKGDFVTVALSITQRYISAPVLSLIRIESANDE